MALVPLNHYYAHVRAGWALPIGAACGLPAPQAPASSIDVPRSCQRRPPRGPRHSTQGTPSTRPGPPLSASAAPGLRPRRPAGTPPGAAGCGGAAAASVERGGAGTPVGTRVWRPGGFQLNTITLRRSPLSWWSHRCACILPPAAVPIHPKGCKPWRLGSNVFAPLLHPSPLLPPLTRGHSPTRPLHPSAPPHLHPTPHTLLATRSWS